MYSKYQIDSHTLKISLRLFLAVRKTILCNINWQTRKNTVHFTCNFIFTHRSSQYSGFVSRFPFFSHLGKSLLRTCSYGVWPVTRDNICYWRTTGLPRHGHLMGSWRCSFKCRHRFHNFYCPRQNNAIILRDIIQASKPDFNLFTTHTGIRGL